MSREKMPKPITTLSEEDREELFDVIDDVLEEMPVPEFVDALVEKHPELLEDGTYWGFSETVIREKIYSYCYQMLIGRDWPEYYDYANVSDEQIEAFTKDLKQSYNEWVAANSK